ncbi:MAG TPA: thioredoxin domain-containing protein [Bryobacteraceae bacterium]|nr:thioredoxin domain-containing protein [Bryobacteraceae bacterium]
MALSFGVRACSMIANLGLLLPVPSVAADSACQAISAQQVAKLITYVQKKFKVSTTTAIELTSSTSIGSSCFRKLEFRSKDSKDTFRLTLFASPDLRYLARDLLDTSIDPIEEEKQKLRELMAGLASDVSPSIGSKIAPVTLTVFSDFQCPYCAHLAKTLRSEVLPEEKMKVRLVFRHYPLPFHPWARAAAEVSGCVADQSTETFWTLHDFIFEHQSEFTPSNVREKLTREATKSRAVDEQRLSRCLMGKAISERIDRDIEFGTHAGVQGTPTLFVNGFRVGAVSDPVQIRTLIREQSERRDSGSLAHIQ